LDAAVDAILKTYEMGTVGDRHSGQSPSVGNVSVLGQRLAWARNVRLVSRCRYNFSLSVPIGADYDLYVYNSTGNAWGEPIIVASSTNATTGGTENCWVTAPYTGTYYVVVKRATETTGSGNFTLSVNAIPVCALKGTTTDGNFYVPNATFVNATALKVEMLFNIANLTGDQNGGTSPYYPAIAEYPDGKVDGRDMLVISRAFNKYEGEVGWCYMADVVPNRHIDGRDLMTASRNFGYLDGGYFYDLSGVTIAFDTGDDETPDANGFGAIPPNASSFNVTRNGTPIGAMITFYGP
jgi:hypothetical protein